MAVFSSQPDAYKAGLALFFVACIVHVIGFASPFWQEYNLSDSRLDGITVHAGLWKECRLAVCVSFTPARTDGWMKTVQAFQCIGLIGLVAACKFAVFINFLQSRPGYTKLVECIAIPASLLGLFSALLYVVKTMKPLIDLNRAHFSWAFGLDIAGSGLGVIASAAIALGNRRNAQTYQSATSPVIFVCNPGVPHLYSPIRSDEVNCVQARVTGGSPPPQYRQLPA